MFISAEFITYGISDKQNDSNELSNQMVAPPPPMLPSDGNHYQTIQYPRSTVHIDNKKRQIDEESMNSLDKSQSERMLSTASLDSTASNLHR